MHDLSFRLVAKRAFSLAFFTAAAAVCAADPRAVDWHDLVPVGWEPPIIAIAHDEVVERGVPREALVAELDNQSLRLPGYMKPVVFEGRSVSEFILVPFLPHQIKHHAHLEANQMVYVTLREPLVVGDPLQPVWVSGTFRLQTVMTDEGPAGYMLTDAKTVEYVY